MLRRFFSSLSLGLLFSACSSPSPATSSSSHWVTCRDLDDCSSVPDAVACTRGYCVDSNGERIEASTSTNGTGGAMNGTGGASGTGGQPSGGSAACDPLAPQEPPITLGTVLGVGKGPDGTTYMVDEITSPSMLDRVFVSDGKLLVRKRITGSGQSGGAPDQAFYTFSFDDGGSGKALLLATEMGQATAMGLGPPNTKGFIGDPGAVTTPLTVEDKSVLTAFTLRNLPGEVTLEYVADLDDGSEIVVTRPSDDGTYDDFRLFWGSPSDMVERLVTNVSRARSGGTTIEFRYDGGTATANFTWVLDSDTSHPGPGILSAGTEQGMTQRFPTPTSLPGVSFSCLR
jgi:hypothetical protein